MMGAVASLVLGAVFLWAAASKAANPGVPENYVGAILGFNGVSFGAPAIVIGVVFVEWLIGISLLTGVKRPVSRFAALFILLIFSALLWHGHRHGIHASCGCLGSKGGASYAGSVFRNGILVILAGIACAAPPVSAKSRDDHS